MQLAISSVNGSLYPWIYKKLKEKKVREIRSMTSQICILVGGVTLLAGLLAPDIVRIMATEEYMEAVWIIAPVSAGVFFFIPVHAVRERGNVLWRKQRDFSDLCFVFCGEYCSEFCGDSGVWILCGGMGEFIFLHAPGFAALSPDEADLQSTSYRRRNSG